MSKLSKVPVVLAVAGSVVVLGIGAPVSQSFLAKHMDGWQVLPQPEQVTELYFTDYKQLSDTISTPTQTVAFAVHNLEHQTTTYRYTLSAISEDTSGEYVVEDGIFSLPANQARVVNKTVVIPQLKGRIAVTVNLGYENLDFANNRPVSQKQSIHYWTTTDKSDDVEIKA